VKLLSLGIA